MQRTFPEMADSKFSRVNSTAPPAEATASEEAANKKRGSLVFIIMVLCVLLDLFLRRKLTEESFWRVTMMTVTQMGSVTVVFSGQNAPRRNGPLMLWC